MKSETFDLPHKGEKFKEAWEEWIEYRKTERKKPVGPIAAKKQLKILGSCSEEVAISIIDKAINHGWQGLWAPKNDPPSKPSLYV